MTSSSLTKVDNGWPRINGVVVISCRWEIRLESVESSKRLLRSRRARRKWDCGIVIATLLVEQRTRLSYKPYLSFRRSEATEKSKQKKGFLPAVEMTMTLFGQPRRRRQ